MLSLAAGIPSAVPFTLLEDLEPQRESRFFLDVVERERVGGAETVSMGDGGREV